MSQSESARSTGQPQPSLAQRLKQERTARGWSTRELERRAQLTAGAISRLESDRPPQPSPPGLARIATALGIPTADLFLLAGYQTANDLPTMALYLRGKYPGLPRKDAVAIEQHVQELLIRHDLQA